VRVQLETVLPCKFDKAIAEVKTTGLLMHTAHPFVSFAPANGTIIPTNWEEKTYWFRLKLFGVVPFGKQAVRITFHEDDEAFKIRDNGYSRLIRRWDHWITIQKSGSNTLYRDTLDLDAGFITLFVWLFARFFYAHRQRRWIRLAHAGFEYENAKLRDSGRTI